MTAQTAQASPAVPPLAGVDGPVVGVRALVRLRESLGVIGSLGVAGPVGSAAERQALIVECDRAVAVVSTLRARLLAAEERAGTWSGRGDRSFDAWRGRTAGIGERAAGVQVRQAHVLTEVPGAAAAVLAGRVTLEHVDAIARVSASGSPAQRAAAQSEEGRRALLAMAERSDAGTFNRAATHALASVDTDGLERDHQAQRAQRFFSLADTPRGTKILGQLDRVAGHHLRLALEAVTGRPPADDPRDHGQRWADGLESLATRALASVDVKPGAHVPPHVSLILTAETWTEALNARRPGPDAPRTTQSSHARSPGASDGEANGEPTGPLTEVGDLGGVDVPPATLEDGTPVPASQVARILCDCAITRIVLDTHGIPLDVGRTQRTFTSELRRAVIARDRQCAWPSCNTHARWCQIHHITWWDRDTGPTSLTNGVLLCNYHHHEVHRRDLTIHRTTPGKQRGRTTSSTGGGAPPRDQHLPRATYEFRTPSGATIGDAWGSAPTTRTTVGPDTEPTAEPSQPSGPSGPGESEDPEGAT